MSKKVLIITYYWPPANLSAVFRWLKFVKYLPEFGWTPVVFSPKNPDYSDTDDEGFQEIPPECVQLKGKIWEPFNLYKKFVGTSKNEKVNAGFLSEKNNQSFKQKLAMQLRANFFIPDARMFWIRPSVRLLKKYLKNNPVDAIVSTGPPHSTHMIAYQLKRKLRIPWLADFRDPWTNMDIYDELKLSRYAFHRHKKLENKVVQFADCIVTVGEQMAMEYRAFGAENVKVITNGYDESDFDATKTDLDSTFSLAYFGTINKARNPEALWLALEELLAENKDLRSDLQIKLVGKADFTVNEAIKKHGLESYVHKTGFVSHRKAIQLQKSSQVLLLLVNKARNAKGILTGKIFEYLYANRPVLAVGPLDGDVAKLLSHTQAGEIADFSEKEKLKEYIKTYYQLFKKNQLENHSQHIEKYARKSLTADLVDTLNSITQ